MGFEVRVVDSDCPNSPPSTCRVPSGPNALRGEEASRLLRMLAGDADSLVYRALMTVHGLMTHIL